MKNFVLAVVFLLAAATARAEWTDGFNRPDGGLGGNWTPIAGTWAVSGNRGSHVTGGNEQIQYNGVSTAYQSSVTRVDCVVSNALTQYSGVVVGLGGSDAILVKLQAQTGNGLFSNIGIYRLATLGGWTGTTTLPGGGTDSGAFLTLPAGFAAARMTVWFPNADVIQVDLDTNSDGIPDVTYTRDGVSAIAGNLGKGAGVGCFGPGLFDNFSASSATSWSDNFNQPDGSVGANWNQLSGTWAVASNQGTHTSGAVNEQMQYINASMRYQDSTSSIDCFAVGASLQYSGLLIGLGGSDAILVKLQGSGNFSSIGIYHTPALGAWTGTTTLPGGGTSTGGFLSLPATFASARLTVSFPSTNVIKIDIDTNFDGVPEYTYTRDGVSTIAANLGTGFGVAGYGPAVFDNFNARFRQLNDGFDRADGAIGGNWAPLTGTWAVASSRGTHTSGSASEMMQYSGASLPYSRSVVSMDCINVGTALEYSGVVVGLGGSNGILVKLQAQTATGLFDRIGIYQTSTLSQWTGTTTLPGGGTDPSGFLNLPAGFPGAARMTVSFTSADVIRIELDTNFDGTPEYVYTRNGVTSISSGLGSGAGVGGFGPAVFDNWSMREAGNWSELGDAGELPSTANAIQPGLGALGQISGNLTAALTDMYKVNICDPANFSATTVGQTTLDTQLFLFNANGVGIVSDDDNPAGGTQSTLTNAFTASLTPGSYYLAISGYNRDPVSGGNLIWNNTPFNVERAPDGPGAGGAVTGWTGTGGDSAYTIVLTGTCYGLACYANCDGSTSTPVLNVLDFSCFLNKFAAGDPYANCDGSTTPPVLNVLDFSCFLNKFAAGCP